MVCFCDRRVESIAEENYSCWSVKKDFEYLPMHQIAIRPAAQSDFDFLFHLVCITMKDYLSDEALLF